MVEPVILERLKAVAPLKAGKTDAVDDPAWEAVPMVNIEAVKQRVKQQTRDLIDLLLLSGARPGEIIGLKTSDIDRSGPVWVAILSDHKTAHLGKTRKIFFGPKAQLILNRYLKANPAARLFTASRNSFYQCVTEACDRAEVPRWSPHWLRHNAATEVRDAFGLEHAQAVAGHSSPNMTARYSTKMDRLAAEVVAKLG